MGYAILGRMAAEGVDLPVSHAHRLYSHNLCKVKCAQLSLATLPLLHPGCQFPHLQ